MSKKRCYFCAWQQKSFHLKCIFFPHLCTISEKNSGVKYLKMPAANPMYYNTSYKCTTITWKLTVVCTQKDTHKKFARGKLSCFNKPERTLYFSFCLANNIGSASTTMCGSRRKSLDVCNMPSNFSPTDTEVIN